MSFPGRTGQNESPWKLRNFEILVIHDFILEGTCEVFACNSTWLASCVVIPIFITVLSPTLLSSHASPEGFRRYYRDFQPRRCRNTVFTAISLNNAPFPSSQHTHIFYTGRRCGSAEVSVLIAEQNGKLGETLKRDDAEMRNLHQHAASFMGLGRNLDRVTQ